jgi:hypothetical protein
LHIEFDVLEAMVVIGAWVLFKWSIRVILIVVIGKAITNAIEKGKGQIEDVKSKFTNSKD